MRHMHYVVLPSRSVRDGAIRHLKTKGIDALFHYVPLHDSPEGRVRGRTAGRMDITRVAADQLLRLPLWLGIEPYVERICAELRAYLEGVPA